MPVWAFFGYYSSFPLRLRFAKNFSFFILHSSFFFVPLQRNKYTTMIFFGKKHKENDQLPESQAQQPAQGEKDVEMPQSPAEGGINFNLEELASSSYPRRDPRILNH